MIKNLKNNDVQNTPFVATKTWQILNTHPQDLLLLEDGKNDDIPPEVFIGVEYIDYYNGLTYPYLNSDCNLALEQQSGSILHYNEGVKSTGFFYPDKEEKDSAGQYKRLVYNEIKNMFYNTYKDPTKMWGLEHIDFPLSNTRKYLADEIRVFSVSKDFFGEKMMPGTVAIVDNALNDTYVINDDSNGNLIAKSNLFSKVQEVKKFTTTLTQGISTYCDTYESNYTGILTTPTSASCAPW